MILPYIRTRVKKLPHCRILQTKREMTRHHILTYHQRTGGIHTPCADIFFVAADRIAHIYREEMHVFPQGTLKKDSSDTETDRTGSLFQRFFAEPAVQFINRRHITSFSPEKLCDIALFSIICSGPAINRFFKEARCIFCQSSFSSTRTYPYPFTGINGAITPGRYRCSCACS